MHGYNKFPRSTKVMGVLPYKKKVDEWEAKKS
jgi:hypothetical protein